MKLNYKILGEGEPIFILHGLFGMLDNWMSFALELSKDYKVILVDHRNHGKSPHSDEISYRLYAKDLYDLFEQLSLNKAHIMGHSMGGKSAMSFAMHFPQLTKSVISVDMGVHAYLKGNHDEIFEAILPLDLNKFSKRSDVDDVLKEKIPDFIVRQFLLKNLDRTDDGFTWKANFVALKKNYEQLRASVDMINPYYGRALIVRGGDSGYIRDQDFEKIKKLFPNAILKTVPEAGHWIHAQKPEELFKLVREFLE
jgi:pimeloyl-ACP methyl ester carboxylesterase